MKNKVSHPLPLLLFSDNYLCMCVCCVCCCQVSHSHINITNLGANLVLFKPHAKALCVDEDW